MSNKDKAENNETTEESLFLHRSDALIIPKKASKANPPSSSLWRQSPTSLRRDRAPSHKIPKAQRFCNTNLNLLKYQQLENLNLERQNLSKTGITFPRSIRPDHFRKHRLTNTPSPASYHLARFMDSIDYKMKTERSVSGSRPKKSMSEIKGSTMNNFFKYHKTYLTHAKNIPYQPQCTIDNPSPAHYHPDTFIKGKTIKYSFKSNFHRFKDSPSESSGPAAYNTIAEQRCHSSNAKGTFPKSCRTYLRTIEQRPGPSDYLIPRFVDNQHQQQSR